MVVTAIIFTGCTSTEITEVSQEVGQDAPTEIVKVKPTKEIPLDTPAVEPVEISTPEPVSPDTSQIIPDVAVIVIEELARNLSISSSEVHFVSIEEVQWPDGCLGAALPDEVCTQMIVDGYRIILEADGQQYEFHTDYMGEAVRQVQGVKTNPKGELVKSPALQNARQFLSDELDVDIKDVKLVSMKAVDWSDSCLEIVRPEMACAAVITPGYQIRFEVNAQNYEVRTDKVGVTIFLVETQEIEVSGGIVWQGMIDGECQKLIIEGVAAKVGSCQGDLTEHQLSETRVQEWLELFDQYEAFTTNVGDLRVVFTGQGKQFATEFEQRSIAEWAGIVYAELRGMPLPDDAGAVVVWHRAGGIAGFCDDVTVYTSGWAYISSCRTSENAEPTRIRLTPEEIEKIFTLYDEYQNFETAQKDPAVADEMVVEVKFYGSGETETAEDIQQEISILAENQVRKSPTE